MSVFGQSFGFFDNPRGGTDQLDKWKAAGFQGGFGNVVDYPASDWDTHRARAKEQGMFFGPWGRTGHPPPQGTGFELGKAARVRLVSKEWGATPYILNCEKEIDNSGNQITSMLKQLTMGDDCALSCEAWPFGAVDWGPVSHLPVLPQIFPQDWGWATPYQQQGVMARAEQCKNEWHRRGVKCVYYTFGTHGAAIPKTYTLQAPFSLYTADAVGIHMYAAWKPTSSGFVGCVEPTPPPKKPVAEYRADIQAIAEAGVAEHNLGPHSRLKIIERIAGGEFPNDQWRVELGPEISLLLDQARGDE